MKTTHTPEPWRYNDNENGAYIVSNEKHFVCESDSEKDAARIVACVNAMAGIEDPEKHIQEFNDLMRISRQMVDRWKEITSERDKAEFQRDELLDALRGIVLDHFSGVVDYASFHKAKELIAKIENT